MHAFSLPKALLGLTLLATVSTAGNSHASSERRAPGHGLPAPKRFAKALRSPTQVESRHMKRFAALIEAAEAAELAERDLGSFLGIVPAVISKAGAVVTSILPSQSTASSFQPVSTVKSVASSVSSIISSVVPKSSALPTSAVAAAVSSVLPTVASAVRPLASVKPVINTLTDALNCGVVGTVCPGSYTGLGSPACAAGVCTLQCPSGLKVHIIGKKVPIQYCA